MPLKIHRNNKQWNMLKVLFQIQSRSSMERWRLSEQRANLWTPFQKMHSIFFPAAETLNWCYNWIVAFFIGIDTWKKNTSIPIQYNEISRIDSCWSLYLPFFVRNLFVSRVQSIILPRGWDLIDLRSLLFITNWFFD